MAEEKLNTGPEGQLGLGDVVKDDPGGPMPEAGDVEVSAEQIEELMAAKKAEERAAQEAEDVGGAGEKAAEAGAPEKEGPSAQEPEKPRRGRRPKEEKADDREPWEKSSAELEAEKKPARRGRSPKADKAASGEGGPGTAEKPKRGRKSKGEKKITDAAKPGKRDKMSRSAPGGGPVAGGPAPEVAPAPEPPVPREPPRSGETEQIVYLDLNELHAFKDHPFGVRDDDEMRALVESVKVGGVNQPALVRPREDGGYEIIAGHRRQKASELAGYTKLPCIVRNMTDDEAVLAMTDDNLRQRSNILPMEKAFSLKMQVEAIKHQGARTSGQDVQKDAGKRSIEIVGERNGLNYKQVQRYIRLTELVPDLQKMVDEKKLSFTPAVEISFIKPANQRHIAVSIEGEQASPSLSQAQELRKSDQAGKLSPDMIDGILSKEKKEVGQVIISTSELAQYFGGDKTPREMKDKIMELLGEWKEKQPPELGKAEKKVEPEK